MIRVVLDTNIILSSIHPYSKYKALLDIFFANKYEIAISNEILFEYEEKINDIFNKNSSETFLNALLISNNVLMNNIFFNFNLLSNDPDDNKFIDCFLCSNANYLVTNDKDYNVLKNLKYPRIKIMNIDEFLKLVLRL